MELTYLSFGDAQGHLSGTGTATKGVNVKEIEGRDVVVVPEWSG